AHMIKDKYAALQVQEKLGSSFNIDEHGALAAYIYAYYAEGHEPDLPMLLNFVNEPELNAIITELSMLTISPTISTQVMEDCVKEILNYPKRLEIDKKEEERRQAERQGNVVLAAQIAMEILAMRNKIEGSLS